jgi:hypothetical protein
MNLPLSDNLPVNRLAACFNNTVATYKYYWFLSFLQAIEKGKNQIPKRELFAGMISNAWYTVNYFRLSFGKQDLIHDSVSELKQIESISIDEKQKIVANLLLSSGNHSTLRILRHFNNQVPHRFLSPWFPKQKDETDANQTKRIYSESQSFKNQCLYALYDNHIIVNPSWINYLIRHVKILSDYCYWNLVLFLQAKNPNIPELPNKLIKREIRKQLTLQRRNYWDFVFKELGSIECIYTGRKLTIEDYAVEHFIPYAFISHDLIWNLIPADKNFNSSKNDRLPVISKHFGPFYQLQKTALEIICSKNPKNKYLLEYLPLYPDIMSFEDLPIIVTEESLKKQFVPLITIASNNGFEFLQ